jgi:hypothetical protein
MLALQTAAIILWDASTRIFLKTVTMTTSVPLTIVVLIEDVYTIQSPALKTLVLGIHVIHKKDVITPQFLVTIIMNVPMITVILLPDAISLLLIVMTIMPVLTILVILLLVANILNTIATIKMHVLMMIVIANLDVYILM